MPKAKKSVKKTTAQKAKKEVVQTTTSAATTSVVKETAPATPALQDQFASLLAQLTSLRSQLTTVTTQVRALSKRADRELKQAQKQGRKKRKTGNRAPSGFVKPSPISDELATFLGKEKGVEMARTDVTREINKYIRAHDLQDKENGRKINPDEPLRNLLKLTPESDIVLTYFNLQRCIKHHFPQKKSGDAVSS